MDTLHLVDPALRPLLGIRPTIALDAATLAEVRAALPPAPPLPDNGVRHEVRRVPGGAGAPEVALHLFLPDAPAPMGCVYHIHGGGYVLGSVAISAASLSARAAALGCAIVSVEYRLAPETVFPGAIEDCHAGLVWTIANAAALGIDRARIGVSGESAGGGLAAALALMVRDRGEHTLAFQHLIYPMIDDRTCRAEPHPHAGQFIWTPDSNRFGWTSLLGHEPGSDGVSPYAAAARAGDLAGLPSTFLSVGALDLFIDENLEYARRLIRAGVPTELHVFPGAYHGFEMAAEAPIAQAAIAAQMAALARFLAA